MYYLSSREAGMQYAAASVIDRTEQGPVPVMRAGTIGAARDSLHRSVTGPRRGLTPLLPQAAGAEWRFWNHLDDSEIARREGIKTFANRDRTFLESERLLNAQTGEYPDVEVGDSRKLSRDVESPQMKPLAP